MENIKNKIEIKRKAHRGRGKFFIAGLICGLAVAFAFIRYGWVNHLGLMGSNVKVNSVVLQEKINEISELATASYTYTNADVKSDSRTFNGKTIPFTTNKYIVKYDGIIKAGVNMEEAQVEVNDKKVVVKLPEIMILSNEITDIDVLDESNNIFNPIKVSDVTDYFIKEQKQVMEDKAIEKGLLDEAKSNAVTYIKAFMYKILPDEYEVEVQ